MKITPEELKEKVINHAKYLKQDGGERLNLTNADLTDAYLRHANLRHADLFNADLRYADLRYANLFNANLSNAYLRHANLRHANLTDANLTNADLTDADLFNANLSNAYLTDADLPQTVKIEKLFTKIQSAIKSGGRLNMGQWHSCKTTHCMAGWVTSLAGETGRVMERLLGTPWAATLIILESCPYLEGKVPDFHSSNEEGMKFINECVDKEKLIMKGES